MNRLRRCYEIIVPQSTDTAANSSTSKDGASKDKEWEREKINSDRHALVDLLAIDSKEALRIVLHGHLRGTLSDSKRLLHHARLYLGEQRRIVKIVEVLFQYRSQPQPAPEEDAQQDLWEMAQRYSTEVLADPDLFTGLIRQIVKNFQNPLFLESDDEDLAALFAKECLLFQVDLLNLLITALVTVIPTASTLIAEWAGAVEQSNYFTYPASPRLDREANLQNSIQTLCLTATIGFLDFEQDFSLEGTPEGAYILDAPTLIKVHAAFSKLVDTKPRAAPVVLGWSFVLNTIAIRMAENDPTDLTAFLDVAIPTDIPTQNRDFTEIPRHEQLAKVASQLAQAALAMDPFLVLIDAVALLPKTIFYMTIYKSFLQASLPYISLSEPIVYFIHQVVGSFPELAEELFMDPFGDSYFTLAALRFPAALGPFLKLSQCLGRNAFDVVSKMSTFMQELPRSFRNYTFVKDTTTIQLSTEITLMPANRSDPNSALVLPVGTKGQTHSFNNARYAIWQHEYNGWIYLCRLLEQYSAVNSYTEDCVAIVNLITNTLSQLEVDDANALLTVCSEELVTGDIVELLFRVLDDAAYLRDTALAKACIDFTVTLSLLYPDRVWSYLGRSKLLDRNGQEALMAVMLGSVEIVTGKYDVTLSILELVKHLIDSVVSGTLTTLVSTKVQSQILAKFVAHVVALFESFAFWAYSDSRQKVKIATDCVSIFSQLLHYSLDIDETAKPENKVTFVLAPSVELLSNQFLSTSKVVMRTLQPLLSNIESTSWSPVNLDSEYPLTTDECDWVYAALKFSADVVRARPMLDLPPSVFEKNLYVLAPHLALLYTRYSALRPVVVDVFIALVSAAWPSAEQPSLLAHLGMHAHMFISNLTGSLENSLENETTITKIAICFASIIKSKQEGLSILLLTGRDTRKTSKIEPETTSLLQVIEKRVSSSHQDLPQDLLFNLLSSMAAAYSNWKLGTFSSRSELTDALISIIKQTHASNVDVQEPETPLESSFQNAIAEKALLILAVQMFKSKDGKSVQKFVDYVKTSTVLADVSKVFLTIKGFRSSLHGNLARNFAAKWPTLGGIKRFSRARALDITYGTSYLFDLDILDRVLGEQQAWMGYRKEVINANLNYSWIDSQLNLCKAWCTVTTSLVTLASATSDKQLLGLLDKVATTAIDNILSEDHSIPILRHAVAQRVELNFMIKYHLARAKLATPDVASFVLMFKLLIGSDFEFLRSISVSGKADTAGACYRPLLRAILISLDSFKDASASSNYQLMQAIHGIFEVVIIKGMKAAVHAAIDEKSCEAADDMVLIISTLQKCLAIPGVSVIYSGATTLMTESECAKSVMSLYSYAQTIIDREDEWAFGELALAYLLEWLNIETMADQLVSAGLLSVLVESPVSQRIQDGGIRPTTHPKLHSLWVKGILPIAIVVLQKLGYRIVQDTLLLIDFFSEQIKYALAAWRNPSDLTLSLITETSQIILLIELVYKVHPSPSDLVLSFVPPKDELIAAFDYLLVHPRFLNASLVATSVEEQKWSMEADSSGAGTDGGDGGNKLLRRVQDGLRDTKELLMMHGDGGESVADE